MSERTYKVVVHSYGVATIRAASKAAAARRARAGDFDSYDLRHPEPAITSLGEGEPAITTSLPPVPRPVVFRTGE